MTPDTSDERAKAEKLRGELLAIGLSDLVSLAEVQQIITHFQLACTDHDRQRLVLDTIGYLASDGLVEIGELPPAGESFRAWQPVTTALKRLEDRFVDHYDDAASWDYSVWLNLTDDGRRAAETMRDSEA